MNIKHILLCIKYLPENIINRINFLLRSVEVGKNFKCYGTIFLRGKGKIIIGDNVTINSCRETNPIGGDIKTILFAKENATIKIGDNTGISNSAIVAKSTITIGNDVFIGGSCKIYDHDFHSVKKEDRLADPHKGDKSKPITISDGAFIGAHTIILKGVTIGKGSVVGAGSVVTKDIPDGEIWAGNPAKMLYKNE